MKNLAARITLSAYIWTQTTRDVERILLAAGISQEWAKELIDAHCKVNIQANTNQKNTARLELSNAIEELRAMRNEPHIEDITWIVTHHCHLNCSYCYVHTEKAKKAYDSTLTFSEIVNVLTQCFAIGARRLALRGGEPFLRTDLPEIILFASELGLKTSVITKAALSRKQLIKLSSAQNLDIGFSLDTIDTHIGDQLYGKKGQSTSLIRSIKRSIELGLTPTIEATITSKNISSITELILFAEAIGVKKLHLREVAPHSVRPMQDLVLGKTEKEEFHAVENITNSNNLQIIRTPAFSKSSHCGEGLNSIAFLPDGTVTKCTASLARNPSMQYGNVRLEAVSTILRGERLAKILRDARNNNHLMPDWAKSNKYEVPCSQILDLDKNEPFLRIKMSGQ